MSLSVIKDQLKRYPLAVVCFALLLVFVVLIFLRGGVLPELSIRETDLNAEIRTIEQNSKSSTGLKPQLEELDSRVEEIQSRLFNRDDRAININFFYALEDRVGVVIANVNQDSSPDPVFSKGGKRELKLHSTLVYNIGLSGSFESIVKFFYEIHQVAPHARIADFQVRSGNEEGVLDANLRILVMATKE